MPCFGHSLLQSKKTMIKADVKVSKRKRPMTSCLSSRSKLRISVSYVREANPYIAWAPMRMESL